MFKLIYGDDLFDSPQLANQMFQDRRQQFHDDYGWDLSVDDLGREIDEYDLMNPLYVILRDNNGVITHPLAELFQAVMVR